MTCVLRAIGERFDVDAFLRTSRFTNVTTFHKGEPRPALTPDAKRHTASGFTLSVSEAGFGDLDAQVEEATGFLRTQEDELRRLSQFPGLEEVCLDFGIQRREVAAQVDIFPAQLLWHAGALDIDLVITHYALADDATDGRREAMTPSKNRM